MPNSMRQPDKGSHYQAYLLRLWRDDDHAAWRVSLQQAGSHETVRFPTLLAAYTFLERFCEQESNNAE